MLPLAEVSPWGGLAEFTEVWYGHVIKAENGPRDVGRLEL